MRDQLKQRAQRLADQANGKPFAVRTGPNSIVRGTIITCEVHTTYRKGARVFVQFKIGMRCGEANVIREFFISKLPA